MASQDKKEAKSKGDVAKTNVTRISAKDDSNKKSRIKFKLFNRPAKTDQKLPRGERDKLEKPSKNPFKKLWNYLKGSWYELRQVRWPDRKSTWQMTGALLIFTTFFILLVLLLDAAFKWLFQQILS